jgi:hypothetical protein
MIMNSTAKRSYRKNLVTSGLIYLNGEEREVSVSNISMTGVLVQLDCINSAENAFTSALVSTAIDFYLPPLRLAGSAEIIRVNKQEEHVSLALKFKDISYNVDNLLYKRKVYRKNLSIDGRILLNDRYIDFQTVNVSVEGLMIRLSEVMDVTEGTNAQFEFANLSLKGEVQVVWVEPDNKGSTLLGLKYLNMNADHVKGIPRFSVPTDAE